MKAPGEITAYALVKDNQIPKDQFHIYAYIFDYIFEFIIYIVIILTIGLFSRRINITLCYLLVTIPLRLFAGGFHANTKLGCTILSYGLFLTILIFAPKLESKFHFLWIFFYLLCWILILSIGLVDSKNKRLSPSQKNVLHHRCVLTFILMTVVMLCLWYNKQNLYYSTISMCVILDTIGLLLGAWKNRRLL
ncbi:MAG: accessory gene regulator B family protein [Lachnospiraceae bacterium]|nr:accessory gene regulator B family protein [Lachnospiraceae bacterium]